MRYLIFLFLVLTTSLALADDANWAAVGTAGNFSKSKTVQMQRETVDVKMDNHGMHVKATFWFKNHGPKQIVKMGFPDYTSTSNDWDSKTESAKSVIKWFRSKVDGKSVKVTRTPIKSGDGEFNSAWVKAVPFVAGQTKRVDVEYFATHGFAGNGWIFNTYVFTTGATWTRVIESGTLTLDWSQMTQYSKPEFKPMKHARLRELNAKHAVLTFSHVKPDFDLDMSMVTGFFNFTLNGKKLTNNHGLPYTNGGAILTGPHYDLLLPLDNISHFFPGERKNLDGGVTADPRLFNRDIDFQGSRKLKLWDGRVRNLRRSLVKKGEDTYVYLKDLVEALGGRYTYNRTWDRVDITLPAAVMNGVRD